MKERITIRLETELLQKINIIAEAKNRNASHIMREALIAYTDVDATRERYPQAVMSTSEQTWIPSCSCIHQGD